METVLASFIPKRFTATEVELLVVLVFAAPWLSRRAHRFLWNSMHGLHSHWGASRAARLLMGVVRRLPLTAPERSQLERLKLYIHEALGETGAAVAGARALLEHARRDGCWTCANCITNIFINAGLYLEALELEKEDVGTGVRGVQDVEELLVRFNRVEAIYNLGGWTAARRRLEQLEEAARAHPFVWNFYPIQRAWILAHTQRGTEALTALETVDLRQVPREYRSEVHYTRAAALLAQQRHEDARRAAHEGIEVAQRASSHRNGLFMQGRIALAAGAVEEALRFFEQGARHRYQGQGGDALLAWGDGLERLGRTEEAREAWRLVVERDPQSGAAWEAASRLRVRTPA